MELTWSNIVYLMLIVFHQKSISSFLYLLEIFIEINMRMGRMVRKRGPPHPYPSSPPGEEWMRWPPPQGG